MENNLENTEEQKNAIEETNEVVNQTDDSSKEMQKNKKSLFSTINFYVNIVLFIVLVILIINPFGNKNTKKEAAFSENVGINIAFLNTDSVFGNYKLVEQLKDELIVKKEKMESEVMSKQQTFQTKLTNFQSNVQNNRITFEQSQDAERKLMQERDEIVALGERYSSDIMALEYQMQLQITDSVINFANRYNKTYNADYILGYTKGGGILVANEKYDITQDIITGLNEEYEKSLKTK
ncbi:MAG: OmpH family outer membrane protein [Bacteroidales bacterium]|nr:OmpH family outer membrane protein [Bacteroidales bacterium]MDD4575932.1 OmpH family outer membrane protein [Bacteroidales bacterium]